MVLFSKELYNLLPEGYGYVMLTGSASIFANVWMAAQVVKARKELNVPYPIMYSQENGGDNKFNCIQRAHQNSLENHPNFLYLLTFSGLQYPKSSSAAGLLYIVARIIYARGYMSGDPKKRGPGGILGHVAELILLGGVVSFATFQLGCFPSFTK